MKTRLGGLVQSVGPNTCRLEQRVTWWSLRLPPEAVQIIITVWDFGGASDRTGRSKNNRSDANAFPPINQNWLQNWAQYHPAISQRWTPSCGCDQRNSVYGRYIQTKPTDPLCFTADDCEKDFFFSLLAFSFILDRNRKTGKVSKKGVTSYWLGVYFHFPSCSPSPPSPYIELNCHESAEGRRCRAYR